ncbi:hypothetical protein PISMIDRAFT_688398 [Pisolithus microcarpus 441]|uniref:Uncharacterized protein n=1 Tax=Pisolithus microcarpus 441 TaxID=765257 RepID=A0A0C9Z1C5_9AGAM|nr:hypothetical protein BKA83DRAFT_688398 [Pisolithus microcarpus]KIK13768.1 hypothetical protein PISMIDRAFT_688398 [Pisolithus microcarpus 441]
MSIVDSYHNMSDARLSPLTIHLRYSTSFALSGLHTDTTHTFHTHEDRHPCY